VGDPYESQLFIAGEFREAADGERFPVIDPSNEAVVGSSADATLTDVEAAVGAARMAFDHTKWSKDHGQRKHCLQQLQVGLRAEVEAFKEMQIVEGGLCARMGALIDSTIDEMSFVIDLIDSFAWETEMPEHELQGIRSVRTVCYEPYGVVGAITPWNAPTVLNLWKTVPALAAGNTVVLKSAPDTPLAGAMLARVVALHTDIPPGVFNVISSSDNAVGGDGLTGDPRVDMFHFTGSSIVGQRIAQRAAIGVRKVVLELGGKSANLILDDADLDTAIPFSAGMCMMNSGQGCMLPTRLIVPASLYDDSLERLEAVIRSLPIGDPRDPDTVVGPIIRGDQVDRMAGLVDRARDDGARVLVGGKRRQRKGFWYEPTLVVDVDEDSELAQTEVFGPVLSVLRYDGTDDEAVRIANNTIYGLSGYIQSRDQGRALQIASRMRSGTISINISSHMAPDSPFGGYGMSGIGREHGIDGWKEFLQAKTIARPAA